MSDLSKRSTVYFDPALHQALKLKAASIDLSVSELVDEAVRLLMKEDQSTEAIAADTQLLQLDPHDATAYAARGRAQEHARLQVLLERHWAREAYRLRVSQHHLQGGVVNVKHL